MDSALTEEQIATIKEIFTLFDQDGDGIVGIEDFAMMVRGLNQFPTRRELQDMRAEIDPENTGCFDFPEFFSLMAKRMRFEDPEEAILNALM